MGSLSDSVIKEKPVTKILFSDNVEWNSKNDAWPGDVKSNVKQQEIKDLMIIS